jgi:hypothetical protein
VIMSALSYYTVPIIVEDVHGHNARHMNVFTDDDGGERAVAQHMAPYDVRCSLWMLYMVLLTQVSISAVR